MRVALVLLGLSACAPPSTDTSQTAVPAAVDSVLMADGMNLLRVRRDPIAAVPLFRAVLARTPTHYGAHYQLATALDESGLPEQARPLWQAMLALAEDAGDEATLITVRERLARPDSVSEEAAMLLGLSLLYGRNDPSGAIERFRKVLDQNPSHYGATYQLARALERNNQRAQAAEMWRTVLSSAERYADQASADTARARLRVLEP